LLKQLEKNQTWQLTIDNIDDYYLAIDIQTLGMKSGHEFDTFTNDKRYGNKQLV